MIGRVLQKLQVDEATALVVVPKWPTQTWFTTFQNLSQQTVHFKPDVSNLILRNNSATEHPLAQKTTFMIGLLSETYPASWKKANVVPVHKKEEINILKNYRTISLLPRVEFFFLKMYSRL